MTTKKTTNRGAARKRTPAQTADAKASAAKTSTAQTSAANGASKAKASTAKTSSSKAEAAKGSPAQAARKRAAAKRFRVVLEKAKESEAAVIRIPFDVQKVFGTRAVVPVRVTINDFTYRTSAFPRGDGTHYTVVNRQAREGAGVRGGQTVTVLMERDEEPRVVNPPEDLARALKANKEAQAAWDKLSYTHRKEHARAVEEAKRPETRRRRVEKAIAQLAAGKKPGA